MRRFFVRLREADLHAIGWVRAVFFLVIPSFVGVCGASRSLEVTM